MTDKGVLPGVLASSRRIVAATRGAETRGSFSRVPVRGPFVVQGVSLDYWTNATGLLRGHSAAPMIYEGGAGSLADIVTTGDGTPVGGAEVRVYDRASGALVGRSSTAGDGGFRFDAIPLGRELTVVVPPAGRTRGPGIVDHVRAVP